MSTNASVITAAVCVYLIMGLAGCANPQMLKDAIENRKAQQCDKADVIVIINQKDLENS